MKNIWIQDQSIQKHIYLIWKKTSLYHRIICFVFVFFEKMDRPVLRFVRWWWNRWCTTAARHCGRVQRVTRLQAWCRCGHNRRCGGPPDGVRLEIGSPAQSRVMVCAWSTIPGGAVLGAWPKTGAGRYRPVAETPPLRYPPLRIRPVGEALAPANVTHTWVIDHHHR